MMIGTIIKYDERKRWGFLKPDDGGKDVFVHYSALRQADIETLAWAAFAFSDRPEPEGRPACAVDIRLEHDLVDEVDLSNEVEPCHGMKPENS